MKFIKRIEKDNKTKVFFMGIPVIKVLSDERKKKVYIFGMPLCTIYSSGKEKIFRILGLKCTFHCDSEVNFAKVPEQTERMDADLLLSKLLNYDVVSFDIFDTACFRKVEQPKDVFTLLGLEMGWCDFESARVRCEEQARTESLRASGTREIQLSEVYNLLKKYHSVESEWMFRECELEIELAVPNPYIHGVYQKLIEAGKKVVFSSDMYLPSDVIEKILGKCGYDGYEKVFLSNKHKVRKGDGTMQDLLKQSYQGKRIIHIGDNENGDFKQCIHRGIDSIYNRDCRFSVREPFMNNVAGSFYRAIVNNNLNNGCWNKDLYYSHGFRVGGVLSAGYAQFVQSLAAELQVDKILFCGRDCYILNRIFNECKASRVPYDYIETSRFAIMNLAPARYAYDILHRFIFRYWNENNGALTVCQLLGDTGFGYLAEYLEDDDIEKYEYCSAISKSDFEMFFLSHTHVMERYVESIRKAALMYYADKIGTAKKLLIVDIGWSGTCITALEYVLQNYLDSDIEVTGALMMASRGASSSNNYVTRKIYHYIANPLLNNELLQFMSPPDKLSAYEQDYFHMPLEYLFTCNTPSLVGFKLDEQGRPELVRNSNVPTNPDEILSMQEGMVHFNKLFEEYVSATTVPVHIAPYTALAPLIATINNKTYCGAVYGNFLYDACTTFHVPHERKETFGSRYCSEKKAKIELVKGQKILFVTPELPYTGAPRSLLRVCRVAKECGYSPIVFSAKPGPIAAEYTSENIPVFIVSPKELRKRKWKKMVKSCKMAYCNTIVTDKYAEIISKWVPTVWFIREATNIPDFCRNAPKRLQRLKKAKHLYCVSDYAANAIRMYTSQPVHVINNCVEDEVHMAVDYTAGSGDTIKFVQFGTMEYRKGYDVLLAAYKSMPEEYRVKSELYFAGGFIKSASSFCSYLFSEMRDVPNVHYLGLIGGERKKIESLSQMDVVVVASRDESCSLVALEGAMLSKPLIVTENVGAKYMVTPGNGYIVATGDVESLRNALMCCIDNKERLAQMGRKSREVYDQYASMERQLQDLKILFDDLNKADKKFLFKNRVTRLQECKKSGAVDSSGNSRVIVSFTSHPGRIEKVAQTVCTLLAQSYRNRNIILWLSELEFPYRERDLPKELIKLTKNSDFEIRWVPEDLKCHKKYYYAVQSYPDYPIVIVDDDALYQKDMLSVLMDSYRRFPDCVSCHRANLIMFKSDGSFRSYKRWSLNYTMLKDTPSYSLLPTGVGGVLYPPNSLPGECFDKEAIVDNCLYADDLWLKFMSAKNGYRTVVPSDAAEPRLIKGSQEVALWRRNITDGNDEALKNIVSYFLQHYPEETTILLGKLRSGHFAQA